MGWLFLFAAGCSEIIFAVSLKYNEGFTKLYPSIVTMISGGASFYLLMLAIKTLPLGTAYAIWTGMGAVGVAVLSMFLFKESVEWFRLVSISLIVLGIIGLKLTHVDDSDSFSSPNERLWNNYDSWQYDWHDSQLIGFDESLANTGWKHTDILHFDVILSFNITDVILPGDAEMVSKTLITNAATGNVVTFYNASSRQLGAWAQSSSAKNN